MTSGVTPGPARFNALPKDDAARALHEICAAGAWIAAVLTGRPYACLTALLEASDAAVALLSADDLAEAMAAHPPIGRPEPGDAVSRREQSAMALADDALRAEMAELNLAYQERFGHVFLICATGRSAVDMRSALRARLGNTPERERAEVRTELGKINRIRLTRLAAPDASGPAASGGRAPTAEGEGRP